MFCLTTRSPPHRFRSPVKHNPRLDGCRTSTSLYLCHLFPHPVIKRNPVSPQQNIQWQIKYSIFIRECEIVDSRRTESVASVGVWAVLWANLWSALSSWVVCGRVFKTPKLRPNKSSCLSSFAKKKPGQIRFQSFQYHIYTNLSSVFHLKPKNTYMHVC